MTQPARDTYFVIDFDSTFTQVEALEELAAISLRNDPDKDHIIEKIKELTDLSMEGKMPFHTSLKARIALLSAKKYHVQMLVNVLRKKVSVSMARNKKFFKEYQGRVLIISGGFREFIVPVVRTYHIPEECVFANTFTYDQKNNITGADEQNPLAQEQGKVKQMKLLGLKGEVIAIGDGFTDYEMYKAKVVQQFYAYTENITRAPVVKAAPLKAASLDEILYERHLPMSISFPKSKITALLAGKATFAAEPFLKHEGYRIVKSEKPSAAQWNSAALAIVENEPMLEQVPAAGLQKLLCAGLWGHTGSLSDRNAKHGIVVFSRPFSESRAEAELALSFMLQLARKNNMELKGRKAGIAGYAHAGSSLGLMLESLGMDVIYTDINDTPPLGKAVKVGHRTELFRKADFIVLTAGECGQADAADLRQMKKDSSLIMMEQAGSGSLKGIEAELKTGKLAGFAMDCRDEKTLKKLAPYASAILTLKSRTATKETAQLKAESLSESLIRFINTGSTLHSVNFPELHLHEPKQSHRFIHIHRNQPGVLGSINSILAAHQVNITGQYLKTNEDVGYVITDVGKEYNRKVHDGLKQVPGTIRFRVLY